jgi:uncharacterized Zn finger protein (UPF0148 family)
MSSPPLDGTYSHPKQCIYDGAVLVLKEGKWVCPKCGTGHREPRKK